MTGPPTPCGETMSSLNVDAVVAFLRTITPPDKTGSLAVISRPTDANLEVAEQALARGEKRGGFLYKETTRQFEGHDPQGLSKLIQLLQERNGNAHISARMGRIKLGSPTAKLDAIIQAGALWVDIDAKKLSPAFYPDPETATQDAVDKLLECEMPPTMIVHTGGGLHAYWKLSKGAGPAALQLIETCNRTLVGMFTADDTPAIMKANAAMRIPGTVNCKYDYVTQIVHHDATAIYDLGETADYLASMKGRVLYGPGLAVLKDHIDQTAGKTLSPAAKYQRAAAQVGARGGKTDDEWEDIINRIAVPGQRNNAWATVCGKLAQEGLSPDQMVGWYAQEYEAQAAAHPGTREPLPAHEVVQTADSVWKSHQASRREADARNPTPAPAPTAETGAEEPEDQEPAEEQIASPGPVEANGPYGAAALHTRVAVEDIEKNVKKNQRKPHILRAFVDGVSAFFDPAGQGRIIESEELFWLCDAASNVWYSKTHDAMARVINDFITFGVGSVASSAVVAEVKAMLKNKTHMTTVPWNSGAGKHAVIFSNNIVIDITTMQELTLTPEMYVQERHKMAWPWEPGAVCPTWDKALIDTFAHIPPAEVNAVLDTVEEWMGTILIGRHKPREVAKAMVFYGPEQTGKSTVIEVCRRMLGDGKSSALKPSDLGGDHSLSELATKIAWLVDEIPSAGKLEDNVFKQLVTNEPVQINPKYVAAYTKRLDLTIGFAGNNLPVITDPTMATLSRIIWVPCLTQFLATNPNTNPDLIDTLEKEGAGIVQRVAWAAHAVLHRGKFDLPDVLLQEQARIKVMSNPMHDYLKQAIVPDAKHAIKVRDLLAGYIGYRAMMRGTVSKKLIHDRDTTTDVLGRVLSTMFPSAVAGQQEGQGIWIGVSWGKDGLGWVLHGDGMFDHPTYGSSPQAAKSANMSAPTVLPFVRNP